MLPLARKIYVFFFLLCFYLLLTFFFFFFFFSFTYMLIDIVTTFPLKVLTPSSGFLDFAISMRPDYHKAIIDTIRYYGWKKIMYLYDSHDGNVYYICNGIYIYIYVLCTQRKGGSGIKNMERQEYVNGHTYERTFLFFQTRKHNRLHTDFYDLIVCLPNQQPHQRTA